MLSLLSAQERSEELFSWLPDVNLDPGHGDLANVEFWSGYKVVRQEGSIRIDSAQGGHGTVLKWKSGLGMENQDASGNYGMDATFLLADNFAIHVLWQFSLAEFIGRATVPDGGYRIGSLVLAPGNLLKSEFTYAWHRAGIGYTVYIPERRWGVGASLSAYYIKIDYTLESLTSGNPGTESGDIEALMALTEFHFVWFPGKRWQITLATHRGGLMLLHRNIWVVNVNFNARLYLTPSLYISTRGEWEIADYEITAERHVRWNVDLYSTWSVAWGIGFLF